MQLLRKATLIVLRHKARDPTSFRAQHRTAYLALCASNMDDFELCQLRYQV